jgi:hypothetical protein
MTDSPVTGTDLVRAALRGRNHKQNTSGFARDLGLSADTLEQFAEGRVELPAEILQKLVRALWGDSTDFDAGANALRPSNREPPRPLGILSPPFDSATAPYPIQSGSLAVADRAPQLVTPQKPKPKEKRAGWLGGWL